MKWTRTAGIYLVLGLGAAFTLAPFLLSILTAFKTREQFAGQSVLAWPDPFTVDNIVRVLAGPAEFGRAVLVTLLAAVLILIGQLVCSILAAYAFARVDFPGRQVLFWVYLSTLMIPPVVLIIPLYLMMTQAGLRNSFWSLVLPFAFASPYAVFLLREYFRGIPQELIDAARLDGANTLDVLVEIVVPLSKPIIATLTLITIVSHWNSFMWPLVVTTGPQWRVVTVATASLQSQFNGNWTLVMAATTLALVPLLVLFLVFQRQFVRSITISGFK
ncbi:multiple sugar transport system permease protein [Cryobacterium sp. MP_M5]|uniref:carbohydrate ABC transporter permease n=1 Tax=unclassified Cryobacterium TaxID=2649013 RepID=UPI0018CAB002|nr:MULTISPECIES: carbohydrate ABC transporter permease [unclassified Cryobacterium]MBG6059086.1 multiple sugar transport system permease protein [Cryobacterium sp. MP_M3]MEC5177380.1 multiple sugar transport system permease protein [Cryobacterium sp. MP_M5]